MQPKAADEALPLFIQDELESQAGFILRPATEALVAELSFFVVMTGDGLVTRHASNMEETQYKTQPSIIRQRKAKSEWPLSLFAVRYSPEALVK
ncbi:MAG TPA: hypothetical protein VKB58_13665 [Terriglobales bacterium]|nr:hypothetical protein [Terriglobales bacterium]